MWINLLEIILWLPCFKPTFSILKIERSAIYQIVCILNDKSISVLKITYGHHPPCIRRAISGTFLSRSTLAPIEIVSLYLKAGQRNQPKSFPHKKYGQGHHIGPTWGSPSPSQESGTSSKVKQCSWWMPNLTFLTFKIEGSGIHQIECILKDESVGVLSQ